MRAMKIMAAMLAVGSTVGFAVSASGQPSGGQPPLVAPSMAGRDLYIRYCGACHGSSGRGTGPAAANLKTAPADLTGIARRREGAFPRDEVRAIVAGERNLVPAHVSNDMPVWADIFQGLDANQRANRVRISNLVDYLASIQVR